MDAEGMETKQVTISGEIKFRNGPPKSQLPNPSDLIVKLQDCRLADASAIDIAVVKVDAHKEYKEGQPLTFKMIVPNFIIGMEYEMSAVLNVGFIPDESKQEWCRKGDYLTDTHHHLIITDANQTELNYNIEVFHYT